MPGLALVFAPLTFLVGPVAAYNVAAVLMPALAAWTAFLLCRYLTGAVVPSLVGGYVFGFSSYEIEHAGRGHLNLTSIFLVPLAALVVLRYLDGRIGERGVVVRLAPLVAFQLLISTEVALTFTLALALALAPVPRVRPGQARGGVRPPVPLGRRRLRAGGAAGRRLPRVPRSRDSARAATTRRDGSSPTG